MLVPANSWMVVPGTTMTMGEAAGRVRLRFAKGGDQQLHIAARLKSPHLAARAYGRSIAMSSRRRRSPAVSVMIHRTCQRTEGAYQTVAVPTQGPDTCFEVDHHGHGGRPDRKSTRLNSSHSQISYAVFCLKKKK